MKKIILLLVGILLLIGCKQEITNFEECVAAGNPVMESYPRQCKAGKNSFTEIISNKHTCTPEEKATQICTMEYIPVCGDNGKTYGNGCSACSSNEINSYIKGECEQQIIGGQTDEYGCLGPAGYSWSDEVGACIREWELDEDQRKAANLVLMPFSYRPMTVVSVETLRCQGCFRVTLKSAGPDLIAFELVDWKIVKKY